MNSRFRWCELREEEEAMRAANVWPEPIDGHELLKRPLPPEWYFRDMEYQYRKGFYHGVAEAAELIADLYCRGGYCRASEIANIIGDWCNDLRRWKSSSVTETPLESCGTPKLKWTPWPLLKSMVHQRDQHRCSRCGSNVRLEAHHIEPVKHGGLPVLDNLVTLCEVCHAKEFS